jgi:hypothetical protein
MVVRRLVAYLPMAVSALDLGATLYRPVKELLEMHGNWRDLEKVAGLYWAELQDADVLRVCIQPSLAH